MKEMNDHPQPPPAGLQSQDEIVKIVAVSAREGKTTGWEVAGKMGGRESHSSAWKEGKSYSRQAGSKR